ncbi:hypothetical protein P7C71_g2672, partial [Lecanoromycetidae sp. Uapishka_2]
MRSFNLLTPLLFTVPSSSLFILLPLYEYPGSSASAWANVTAAVAAYPDVQWQVIINPDSGPGTSPNSYPTDANYITGISKLNSYPNVITLGYVDTGFTNTPYTEVVSNISTYAYWASYTEANISIGGIFLDDVSNSGAKAALTYYHNASAYAYKCVPSDVTPVVFNPGSLGPNALFSYCDTMVEFESPLSSYNNTNATTIKTLPTAYLSQSAIIIYDTTSATDVQGLVHTMSQYDIGAVYLDPGACTYKDQPTGCYNYLGLTNLEQLAAAVRAG